MTNPAPSVEPAEDSPALRRELARVKGEDLARFQRAEERAEEGPFAALARFLQRASWPAAIIALCATAWWFLPPIKSASSEAGPVEGGVAERLARIEADLATVKGDVREIRGVLLKGPR